MNNSDFDMVMCCFECFGKYVHAHSIMIYILQMILQKIV